MNGLDRNLVEAALPQYSVEAEIGRGAWGIVLAAVHRGLGRRVAVKQLPRAYAVDDVVRQRFVDEARIVSALDHPHVVPVYDLVEHEGLHLIVMELLEGGTLWDRFASGGVAADSACAIALALSTALEAAHRQGVLHRDLKPENVLFTANGTPKLSDFGVAKVIGASRLTVAGDVLGTPAYMSPEQVTGSDLGPPSDVYSLGVVLYELLAGRPPFDDTEPMRLLTQHASVPPPPVCDLVDVPPPLADVIMRSLAKTPRDRFDTAEAFGIALGRATAAGYGPTWLRDCGVPVLGGGPAVTAASAAGLGAPATTRPTISRPAARGRIGHSLPSASPVVVGFGARTTVAPHLTPSTPQHGGSATVEPRSVTAPRRRRTRLARIGLLAAVIVAGVAAAVTLASRFLLDGSDTGSSSVAATVDGLSVLGGSDGRTLYVFTRDEPGKSNCNDPCSVTWPPVPSTESIAGVDAARLTTVVRDDGSGQLALDAQPLYYYIADEDPGDVTGHDVGGVWFAVGTDLRVIRPQGLRIGSTDAGDALVDGDGFTLYTNALDAAGTSTCDHECTPTWQPAAADDAVDAALAPDQFGVITRDDGSQQLTLNDAPLYRFRGDEHPGDANGAGIDGVWNPVPAPRLIRSE